MIREALTCWEYQYLILTWYIDTYASPNITVPTYIEPVPLQKEVESVEIIDSIRDLIERLGKDTSPNQPSMKRSKAVREISYKDQSVEVPYFLRDAFLLQQRFPKVDYFFNSVKW